MVQPTQTHHSLQPEFALHETYRILLAKMTHYLAAFRDSDKKQSPFPTFFNEIEMFFDACSPFLKKQLDAEQYLTFQKHRAAFRRHSNNFLTDYHEYKKLLRDSTKSRTELDIKYRLFTKEIVDLNLQSYSESQKEEKLLSFDDLEENILKERLFAYKHLTAIDELFGLSVRSPVLKNPGGSFLFFRVPNQAEWNSLLTFQRAFRKGFPKRKIEAFQLKIRNLVKNEGLFPQTVKLATESTVLQLSDTEENRIRQMEAALTKKNNYSISYFLQTFQNDFFSERLVSQGNRVSQKVKDGRKAPWERKLEKLIQSGLKKGITARVEEKYKRERRFDATSQRTFRVTHESIQKQLEQTFEKQLFDFYRSLYSIQDFGFLDSLFHLHEMLVNRRETFKIRLQQDHPAILKNFTTFVNARSFGKQFRCLEWNVLDTGAFFNIFFSPLYLNEDRVVINKYFSGSFINNAFQKNGNQVSLYQLMSHHIQSFRTLLHISPYQTTKKLTVKEKFQIYRQFLKTGILVPTPSLFWDFYPDSFGFFGIDFETYSFADNTFRLVSGKRINPQTLRYLKSLVKSFPEDCISNEKVAYVIVCKYVGFALFPIPWQLDSFVERLPFLFPGPSQFSVNLVRDLPRDREKDLPWIFYFHLIKKIFNSFVKFEKTPIWLRLQTQRNLEDLRSVLPLKDSFGVSQFFYMSPHGRKDNFLLGCRLALLLLFQETLTSYLQENPKDQQVLQVFLEEMLFELDIVAEILENLA